MHATPFWPTFALLSMASAVAHAAAADSSAGARCELLSPAYDARQVECSLPPTGEKARRYRLRIDFAGGHDDTMARFNRLVLNGVPLACEAPSKTELMGEDGNVSIDCRFSLPAGRATPTPLVAVFQWSHAQYVDHGLTEGGEATSPPPETPPTPPSAAHR